MKFLNNIQVGSSPNFTLPTSDGSANQILQTDGSGTVTWEDLPAGTTDTNDYVTAAAFNTSTGVVTLTVQNQTAVTVNLDGRYLTAHPNISGATTSNNSGNTFIQDLTFDSNGHVTGLATGTGYESWLLNGTEITDEVAVVLPISYVSGSGTPADPAIHYSTLTASNGLTFTTSSNSIELDEDLRNHVTFVGDDHDYHRYDIKGRVSSYVSSTAGAGGTTSEQMRLVHENAHFAGDVIAFSSTLSDKRLKDDVQTIEDASKKVSQLRGVEYTWNKGSRTGEREIGLIAQEVESVIPEVVREKEMQLLDGNTYKTVDYEKIIALLIESNKEQQEIISQLEERIIDIENRL